ncbi:MAG TPA: sensor histidine kinase [Polyangiaceae bacterium]|nr:sensor histidine kinase [Polyangiaceae bacterium]
MNLVDTHSPITDDVARAELFRLRMQNWRLQLLGAGALTALVASVFDAYVHDRRFWIWTGVAWTIFGTQAWLCIRFDRIGLGAALPRWWWRWTLVLAVCVGVLWSSLPWLLPASNSAMQLLGAFASMMVALGSASSSNSNRLLLAIMIPAGLMIPSALVWHAGLPVAGVVSVLLMLGISEHGLSIQRVMLSSIHLRHRADALAERLRHEQSRAEAALRQQALLDERQRVMRELHDGLGSSLISTLVAVERGNMQHSEVLGVLRECVDDLRMVMDSLEPIGQDLVLLLATLRHRLGDRLELAGLNLSWEVNEVPLLTWLGPAQALQVMRMVQEALTNVLKHAKTKQVRITTEHQVGSDHVAVLVEDEGIGFDPKEVTVGRGLSHLRSRAEQLGVTVEVRSAPGAGTRVRLELPLEARRAVRRAEPWTGGENPTAAGRSRAPSRSLR